MHDGDSLSLTFETAKGEGASYVETYFRLKPKVIVKA